jgi:heme A synthase
MGSDNNHHQDKHGDSHVMTGVIMLLVAAVFVWLLMTKLKPDAKPEHVREATRMGGMVGIVALVISGLTQF